VDHDEQGGGQIGQLLENKRREKGLSLKDVEEATKIRKRYLEGLEREDYAMLPDPIYAHGFLKTYANFLGLDGENLSRGLKDRRAPRRERRFGYEVSEESEFDQPLIDPGGLGGTERRKVSGAAILTVVLAVLVLAAIISVLYFIGRGSQQAESPVEEEPAAEKEPAEEEPAAEKEPAEEEPAAEKEPEANVGAEEEPADEPTNVPASETVQATVRVPEVPAGLTISVDGTVADDRFAQPGFSQTFEGQRVVTVSTANAGAVEVEVNGQDFGSLGSYGQPVTRDFTPDTRP
jgi:cytoskeleton protein RodZ